jgi:3-methyl-2-oxobutanoate hydroxymethyltransferase
MLHHTRAVARGVKRAAILADLPINTFNTPKQAVDTSRELVAAGAHAVKLEGGASHVAQVKAISDAGISVMAHIGMQPQRVRIEGGYRIKGKTPEEADALMRDARAAEDAGAFGLLLELVQPDTARRITETSRIPTIGIGSGLGLRWAGARYTRSHRAIPVVSAEVRQSPAADVAGQMNAALREYLHRVKSPVERAALE